MKLIDITNLSFAYRESYNKALSDINFELYEGEMVAIIGRSGAGKSTFCRCLNGIIPNFIKGDLSGDINILEKSTKGKQIYELAQNVGLVFQDFESQLFSTSAELEVAFGPENLAVPPKEIRERIYYALKIVGLEGFENRQPFNLSGGEKQRLAIASVLSSKPKIIVLDEPATDLDPKGRHDIFGSLQNLKKESMSIILVEHDTEDIIDTDRIIIIDFGRIISSGKTEEILKNIRLLEDNGLRPPQLTKLFSEIGSEILPLTAKEAYKSGKEIIAPMIDSVKYNALLSNEFQKDKNDNIALDIKGLSYSYQAGEDVLKGIDISIKDGEFVAIIGQNGSGKTTLVKHFNGLLRPSKGNISCFGKDISKMKLSDIGKVVGYVFQNPDHQIFANTVKEELAFGPRNYGLSEEQILENSKEAINAVHLQGYEEHDPFSLSKGERQRVAVASVLSCKPKVLILDEPTTGLDYPQQKSMMELLVSLNQAGHTIIIITHSLWVVAEYAHRAIVMDKGSVIMDGTVREIFSRQDELESAGMKVPELIKFSDMMGLKLLSFDEYKSVLVNYGNY